MTIGVSNIRYTHIVTTFADGSTLYADLTKLPLSSSIGRNPHLLNLIEEAVAGLNPKGQLIELEYDMHRTIGYTDIVAIGQIDSVFYARQSNDSGYTRFVKNHKSDPASFISVVIARDKAGDYEIQDTWLGKMFPALPGEPDETATSKAFWQAHAVVYNGQPLIASTITKTCPY